MDCRTSRGTFLLALALSSSLLLRDATADELTPIELTMLGPEPVRIRVAQVWTFPCDSADNRPLLQGKFNAGEVIHAQTADTCICFQQTFSPFTDIDWAPASRICRPQLCKGAGRAKRCIPAVDPTIRIGVRSTRP